MLYVALFRNLNLGQGWAPPTGAALEVPFRSAGATAVRSFQTNGTVLFDPAPRRAATVVREVRTALRESYGYTDLAVVVPVADLVALVEGMRDRASQSDMVSFFDGDESAALASVSLLGTGPRWVVSRFDRTPDDPTRQVITAIGPRSTSRTFGTVHRLVASLGLVPRPARG